MTDTIPRFSVPWFSSQVMAFSNYRKHHTALLLAVKHYQVQRNAAHLHCPLWSSLVRKVLPFKDHLLWIKHLRRVRPTVTLWHCDSPAQFAKCNTYCMDSNKDTSSSGGYVSGRYLLRIPSSTTIAITAYIILNPAPRVVSFNDQCLMKYFLPSLYTEESKTWESLHLELESARRWNTQKGLSRNIFKQLHFSTRRKPTTPAVKVTP